MPPNQSMNNNEGKKTPSLEEALTREELAVVNQLSWAKERELVRHSPERKLIRLLTPHDENTFWTVTGAPDPQLIFHEPVNFVVTVKQVKHGCNAGYEVGDRWEFSRCTPLGLCGFAYHSMYPVLHGLMMTSGLYEGPVAEGTLVSCPDEGEVTFHIERFRWTLEDWESENS